MSQTTKYTKHGYPLFNGKNYAFWSTRMNLFLQAQGLEVWKIVKTNFTLPEGVDEPIDPTERRKYVHNSKAMSAILGGITKADFVKVRHCISAKEIWDKLNNIYEGDVKVKGLSFKHTEEILNNSL